MLNNGPASSVLTLLRNVFTGLNEVGADGVRRTRLHQDMHEGDIVHIRNAQASGVLDVSGATHLSSTLDVSGATHMSSTLNVAGATRLASTLDASGATHLGSTLNVAGATRLATTLDASGATHLGSTLDVLGATRLVSTLDASGATHLGSTLDVLGATRLATTLDASGATHLGSTLDVLGATRLVSTLDASGATHLGSTLDAAGATRLATTLDASGATHLGSTLDVAGATRLASTLDVSGAVHIDASLVANNFVLHPQSGTASYFKIDADGPSGLRYPYMQMTGGNSYGYVFGAYNGLGAIDGINLSYNYYNNNSTDIIPVSAGQTSNLRLGYGKIVFQTGGTNTAPTTRAIIDQSGNTGIGTATPTKPLDVSGNAWVRGGLDVSGTFVAGGTSNLAALNVSQNSAFAQNVDVSGNVTIDGTLTTSGAITLSDTNGTNLALSANLDVSGTTHLGGTLDVSGGAWMRRTLDVSGAVHLGDTLDVSGGAWMRRTFDVSGAVHFDSTLDVSGGAWMRRTLDVSGTTHLGSTLDVSGGAWMRRTLDVSGAVHLGDTLDVAQGAWMRRTLDVSGVSHFGDTVFVNAEVQSTALQVSGPAAVLGDMLITGPAIVESTLDVSGQIAAEGATLYVDGPGVTGQPRLYLRNTEPTNNGRMYYFEHSFQDHDTTWTKNHLSLSTADADTAAQIIDIDASANVTFRGSVIARSTLDVSGATHLNTLDVSGSATLNTLSTSGNAAIGGGLSTTDYVGVGGAFTAASTANVTGATTLRGGTTVYAGGPGVSGQPRLYLTKSSATSQYYYLENSFQDHDTLWKQSHLSLTTADGVSATQIVDFDPSGNTLFTGDVSLNTGHFLNVPVVRYNDGTRSGTIVASDTTSVDSSVVTLTANSVILLTVKTASGANAGEAYVTSVNVGTGKFTIKSGAADTSTYNFMILEGS
jgi:hypothetical protein